MKPREPHLVLRFAVACLAAFLLVGVGAMAVMIRYARDRAEAVGAEHAHFIGRSVLAPVFDGVDLTEPLRGSSYARVRQLVRERVLSDGRAVRVKIWRFDGTIVFSDEPALVGARFEEETEELEEVAAGHTEAGVSDLDEEENAFERDLADKLFFTYSPLRTDPGGPVVAVAEIYQDYAFIQQDIDAVVRRVAVILVVGLAVLYTLLLPIALRASRELRRRNERLEELLAREQQTVAELRDLARKKDDFVSAASHELRTPLTSILGSLATLKRSEVRGDPAVRTDLLDVAERQAKRLQRLITNVLVAAQLEGARPVEIEQVDLDAVVRTVCSELEATDRVRVDVPAGSVATDRARLAEALTYLLDNALKYSPAAAPVDVGGSVGDEGYRLWITDHGVGIDPEHHGSIFERFHQIDQSATRLHGGLGLGLYLADELVQGLGGVIEVASSPGRGSTFTVVVPRWEAPDGPARSEWGRVQGQPLPAMNADARATSSGILPNSSA